MSRFRQLVRADMEQAVSKRSSVGNYLSSVIFLVSVKEPAITR